MPRVVFLLGPDQWDGEAPSAPAWLRDPSSPYQPKDLRVHLARMISEEDGTRRGVVMDPAHQRPDEPPGEFFRRLELEHSVDAYCIIVPHATKVLGTVFEGGMLERDFHYGQNPRILLLLDRRFAVEHRGVVRFTAEGKRTRYLESLASRAHHVAFWDEPEDLVDLVLEWTFSD